MIYAGNVLSLMSRVPLRPSVLSQIIIYI